MAEIRWTSEAHIWLKDIFDHIAHDNPLAATEVVEGIYSRAQVLREHPRIGYRYDVAGGQEVRVLLYGTTELHTC